MRGHPPDGHDACAEGHSHDAAQETKPAAPGNGDVTAGIGAFAAIAGLALAGDGNFAGASAMHDLEAPMMEGNGDGGDCGAPGPQGQRARSTVEAQLSTWERELQGAGVGRQYGYAYCGSEATRVAAQTCADEFPAMGDLACAATLQDNARSAAAKAQESITLGRDVGVDARQTGPCAG